MKKAVKVFAVMVACLMVLALLPSCGSSNETTVTANSSAEATVTTESTGNNNSSTDAKPVNGVKKKIVVVQENENFYIVDCQKNIIKALEDGGYTDGTTAEITVIRMGGDESKCQETADKIKELKPDVAILNMERFDSELIKLISGIGIPIINHMADSYVDEAGTPKSNVTGVKSMPADMQKNAFAFLNKIAPINGKKAVFITDGLFTKEGVQKGLQPLNIELKDFVDSKYMDDYQAAVKKYNSDTEVGWILIGLCPSIKKDGSKWTVVDSINWDVQNRKKPTVTYWEAANQLGFEVGLAVDIPGVGTQLGDMAVRILNGEKIKDVKAQDPKKINIIFNQARAKSMGIVISPDDMSSASKIYTDYKGTSIK